MANTSQLESDVIAAVIEMTGDAKRALQWYRNQPIPAYDGRTARKMVVEGHGRAVPAFLKDLENGATG